jgi:hypothetical protein
MVSTSRVCLLGDEVVKILEETRSDNENSLCDSDDDSSVIEDLPIHEAIAIEESENKNTDIVQDSTSGLQHGASVTQEDMSNYVGRREQFIGNFGPQNEAKIVTEGVDAFKMFFTQELIEITVCKTNIYDEQCILSREITLLLRPMMRLETCQ